MAIRSKYNVTVTVRDESVVEDGSELHALVGRLLNGKESFLVWADVVSREQAREVLSCWASRILQALPTIVADLPGSVNEGKFDDIQAQMYLDIGDLCLDYNCLTYSAARACLEVALKDLALPISRDIDVREPASPKVRRSMALGLLIAKLSCRLKYAKSYADLDHSHELEVANKLKNL